MDKERDRRAIVLKSDRRGRVRTSLQQRLALVAEFERSGMPASKFTAMAGVCYQTFATWVQRHRIEQAPTLVHESGPVRFAEAILAESDRAPRPVALRVVLAGPPAYSGRASIGCNL